MSLYGMQSIRISKIGFKRKSSNHVRNSQAKMTFSPSLTKITATLYYHQEAIKILKYLETIEGKKVRT
jgi:hypothetical protein